jgi:hypothetical protein
MGFLQWTQKTKAGSLCRKLLKFNRNHLWWVVELFTEQDPLKGHLFKIALTNSPIWERCSEKDESALYKLLWLWGYSYLRFHHLGHYFMKPGNYHEPHLKSPALHSKGWMDKEIFQTGEHNRSWRLQYKGCINPAHTIHTCRERVSEQARESWKTHQA